MKRAAVFFVCLLLPAALAVPPAGAQSQPVWASQHPYLGSASLLEQGDPIAARSAALTGAVAEEAALTPAEAPSLASILNQQLVESSLPEEESPAGLLPSYGPWVGVAKWAALGVGAGFAALGFAINNEADDAFRELSLRCDLDPESCELDAGGDYVDPELEALYQDILNKDQWARISLIAAQVSFGASLALFVIDFQRGEGPEDVPYVPPEDEKEKSQVRLSVLPGEVAVRYYFR